MCGIVGVACFQDMGLVYSQMDMFRQLLIVDSLRGIDGAGIARITKQGLSETRKIHGSGFDLFRAKNVNEWYQKAYSASDKILIGHNRFASVGSKTNKNAHPFIHDHITLVHNGYISNLSEFGKKPKQFEVDSEGLTFAIAKRGILPVLEKLKGAYSIVYFDSNEKKLNFARNNERPMYYSYNPDRKLLAFGSEEEMLALIITRLKERQSYHKIEELPIHKLMSFSFDGVFDLKDYTPPKTSYAPTWPSQLQEEETMDWVENPDTGVLEYSPKVPVTPVTTTPVVYTPPSTNPIRGIVKNISDLCRQKGGKSWDYPTTLFGYKKDQQIQFVGMEKHKNSETQDQWLILGAHSIHDNLEIKLYVKGEKVADTLLNADMLDATVRVLQHDLVTGKPTIIVSNPKPIWSYDNKAQDNKSWPEQNKEKPEQGVLLLPASATKH